ncbi:hypothetical protein MIND_01361700 [Mycena indigotica]|uniref:Uncharacterized protein n=1 Tax=Mycena indigotica TaxID=2126181 RepID=A0A8H6RZM0_9AGAR|nr:uncharacterized protein MIND_01361700 [Mycena indigotica]KAF7289873.1 hypothetical protein MIND_01361700 [Mycena indigotica]
MSPPDNTFVDPVVFSEWHTIRPGKPPLTLTVREITSVSVTFILSSTFSDLGADADPYIASLGLAADDNNDEHDDSDNDTDDSVQKKTSVIAEALAKGLSVNVNNAIWKGVYIRVDDKTEEAVIIIYGLMPGKKYDIDLGLVQGNIRQQVVTDDLDMASSTTLAESDSFEGAESPIPTPSSSPSGTISSTPPAAPHPQMTLEDRLKQLQSTLSLIDAERDGVTLSLKTARRDAQKADAALRSEIEILKRASEKHAVAEHRARQKVLALQEAAKRAQTSTKDIEGMVVEVEAELPALLKERSGREKAYARVKEEADRARREREREEDKERRKVEAMKNELNGLGNKMEKLTGKREKLETVIIPDLEEQLREIELEIERIEADPLGYAYSQESPEGFDEQAPRPGIIPRPAPIPIQRPGLNTSSSRSSSDHPFWRPNNASHQRSSSARNDSSSSLSSNSSPIHSSATLNTSTLSGRAAPFEPGKILNRPSQSQWIAARAAGKW